jgi:hypothetical protein
MTYETLSKEQLSKKWKVAPCHSGESCWCRCVVTADHSDESDLTEIISAGTVSQYIAEHIVELHNRSITIEP